jgi:predicted aspartyl protease
VNAVFPVRRLLSACLCAAACAPCGAAPLDEGIPFRTAGKIVLLDAVVNGQGPFAFILDTGASETVITPPLASRLGMGAQRDFTAARPATARSLAVGGASVRDLDVAILDPPQAVSLRLDLGVNYQGLLGYTFLSRFVTTLDYGRQRVWLDPLPPAGGQAEGRGAGGCTVPVAIRERLIYASGRVNGKGPFTFLIDTGSAEVLLTPRTAQAAGAAVTPSPDHRDIGRACAGRIALGKAEATNVTALVRELPRPGPASPADGILGFPYLSKFRATFDYRNRVLRLAPASPAP